jgi:hypothetical protein
MAAMLYTPRMTWIIGVAVYLGLQVPVGMMVGRWLKRRRRETTLIRDWLKPGPGDTVGVFYAEDGNWSDPKNWERV